MSKFCSSNVYLLNYRCSAVTIDRHDAAHSNPLSLWQGPRVLYRKPRFDERVKETKLPIWTPTKQLSDYSSNLEKIPIFYPTPNPIGLPSLSWYVLIVLELLWRLTPRPKKNQSFSSLPLQNHQDAGRGGGPGREKSTITFKVLVVLITS